MSNGNDNNSKNGIRTWTPIIVAIIGTFGAGAGANYLLVSRSTVLQEIARPDPFTGAQARALEQRTSTIEKEVAQLRRDVDKLPPRELTERILAIELELRTLRRDIEKAHSN